MSFDRKNLLALMYATNECYTRVVELDDKDLAKSNLVVDEQRGVWSLPKDWQDPKRTWKIGESRYVPHGSRYGVIGVYDRSSTQQLDSMVHSAGEATRSPHYGTD